MKFAPVLFSTGAGPAFVGAALIAFGLAAVGQSTTTRVVTVKPIGSRTAETKSVVQKPVRGAGYKTVKPQSTAAAKPGAGTKVLVQRKSTPRAVPVAVKAVPLVNGVHPRLPNPPGSTVNSLNFGSMEVQGAAVTMTLQYATPVATLTAAAVVGADFKVTSSSCGVKGCTVTVSFAASYPGLRRDAITLTDSGGNLVYETYVYGLGMAPQFGYELGDESIYFGFTNSPMGVALGPDGRVYYTSTGGNSIYIAAHDFSSASVITLNGLGNPSGIAVDSSNTLYVADQANNQIISYNAAGVQTTLKTTPLSGPSQIAVDGTGALYIADTGNGRVIKLDNQGVETTLASGLTTPEAVAVDSNGNVFYTDAANNGEIFELKAGSQTSTTYQNGLNQVPRNLAVDASGALYLTTDQGLNIFRPGSQIQYAASGTDVPYGLAVDQNGDIYLTQPLGGTFSVDARAHSNFILSAPPGTTTQGTLTISNTGNEALTLGTLSITGTVFSIDPSAQCVAGGTVASAGTCYIPVNFMPPAAMDYHGVLTVTSDSLHTPGTADVFNIAGSGQGFDTTTALTASPNPVQSGNPVTLLVTVTDSTNSFAATGALTFMDGSTVLGTAILSRWIRQGTATAQFTVPSLSVGDHLITASFAGDTNLRPSISNTVTVTATNGPPAPNGGIPVGSQDFGSVTIGQSKSIDLTYPFAMNVPIITGAQNSDFSVSPVNCSATCTVTVTFTPQFPGRRSDVITVVDSGNLIAKTFIIGNGVGPQFGFDPGTDNVDGESIQTPTAMAVGPFSTAYIADTATDQIYAANSDQVYPLLISNLGTPGGVAVDAAQVVYVTDQTHNLIVRFDVVSQVQGTVATSQLSQPTGIAVDGTGSLYITDAGNNRVIEIDNQGKETTLASGVASLGPIAVDSAGNVYYATTAQPGGITELPAAGGQPIVIANNIGSIHGLAVDAGGRVYFTNDAGLSIIPLPSCSGCSLEGVPLPGSGTYALYGLALAPNGDIYSSSPTNGAYGFSRRSTSNYLLNALVGSSAQESLLVSNTGNAPLTISNLSFTGTAFTLDPNSVCVNGVVVQAGMVCATLVDFKPTAAQDYQETLTFTSDSLNQGGTTNDHTLYGTGVAVGSTASTTTLAVSPSTAALGQPVILTATVTEATNTPPSGTVNFLDGGTLIATSNLGYQLSGGTATAQYTTTSLGVGSHSITAVYSGDANFAASTSGPQTVTISATPPVAISSQNFGSVAVGQSVSMTIFYAQGTNPTISAVNNLDFTVSSVLCTTGCTATVTFAPQYPGLRADAITVTSNGTLLAKTFIYGTGTGPQLGFNAGLNTVYPNFVQQPTAIALSPGGAPFVSDIGTNKVIAITPNQQSILPITSLGVPAGLAIDGSNTLYVADRTNNLVRFFNLVTQAQGTLTTTPLSSPGFLAVDGAGSVYISDNLNQRIIKVDNQGVESTVANGLNSPQGVAVDGAGNIYYADAGAGGEIVELPVGGGPATTLGTNLGAVLQIAVDASGSIYYVGNFSLVRVIVPGVNNPSTNFGILGSLSGIVLGQNGDVYTTQSTTGLYAVSTRGTSAFNATSPVGQMLQESGFGVVNTGNAPLTISNLSFATGTVFTVDGGSPCVNGIVLGPGRLCNTLVDFLPTAAQTYTDQLTFTSNSLNAVGAKNFNNQTGNGTGPIVVSSTTALVAVPDNSTLGQAVTFTATVFDAAAVTPTGTVNFLDGTAVIGSTNLGASTGSGSAVAQFTTSSLAVGTHPITAVYVGDVNVSGSASSTQPVAVAQASTSTGLSVSAASVTVGQPETLTATIVGGVSPAVSGIVTFFDGTVSLGSSSVTATGTGGTATLTVATLAVGTHSITARYSGDANYTASTSAAQTVTVTQIATTTALGISAATITLGQSETLTATIGGSASPALSGTVTFFEGTVSLGTTAVAVANGVGTATLTVATLGVGAHSITARYSGDINYAVSTSAAQTVTVGQGPTVTTLGISAANISLGQTETLTASLQIGTTPAATGNVSFFDGAVLLGSSNITATATGATATLTVNTLLAGLHSITARYNGDTNYAGSNSAAQNVTVAQASTTTTLGISAANISVGQTETLSAIVQGLASPPLTATVVFYDGAAVLGTQPLTVTGATGSATLSVSTLAVGSHAITAMYSGDTNYTSSTSLAQTVTVSLATQTITFVTIPSHIFGDPPFALSASASSGLAVSYTVVSGPATLSGSTLTLTGVGTVVIQATQAGNATYSAATSVTQSFAVATPTPTLTSFTPTSAVVGSPATTITLTGTNFSTSDTVQVNGAAVATTFVNATTLTAMIPASALATAGTAQIRVSDASNGQVTAALPFTVLTTPAITFSGPTTAQPAQQPVLTFVLVNPYPVAITATLTLTFAPQSAALTDDPAIQFSAGGRTLTFSIPANSQVTPAIQLQSGTVAGQVTVIPVITANGVNVTPSNVVPVVITIPTVVPAISTATITRSGKTLTVVVLGYSNTREVTTAMFHFTAANGSSISDPDVTAPVTSAFATWFASSPSTPFGSTFTYTQDFTLSNDASTIGSVTVTLVNSIGTSAPGTAQ